MEFRVLGTGDLKAGRSCVSKYVGGYQNYGPFWVPNIVWHLIFKVPKNGR